MNRIAGRCVIELEFWYRGLSEMTRERVTAKFARRALLVALTLGVLVSKGALALHEERLDPLALYGERLAFDVWRDGYKVGEHHVAFHRDGEELRVQTDFGIEIKVLFIKAYSFTYSSNAIWHDGQLKRLRAITDDDGERREVTVAADAKSGGLRLHNGEDWHDLPSDAYPTNHWHAGVLHQETVINTLTGQPNDVQIVPIGKEMIETANGTLSATRYRYSGDLETEVWYDDWGRWVKMRFRAEDGSTIDYRCRTCTAGSLSLSRQ